MQPAVSVRDVRRTYSSGATAVQALDGVDLDLRCGELVLLVGPSGSGKTTLLSIIGCILRPTSGSVLLRGRQVTVLPERELPSIRLAEIGFIFQNFHLFPSLTAGENVELALKLKGVKGRQARHNASELIERVGLADKYDVFPANLSGGQQQRIAIARALAGSPPIILADEPTAMLDIGSGSLVVEHLRRLAHEEDHVVLVVTHDQRLFDFADRIVRIEDGRIREPARAADRFRPERSGREY